MKKIRRFSSKHPVISFILHLTVLAGVLLLLSFIAGMLDLTEAILIVLWAVLISYLLVYTAPGVLIAGAVKIRSDRCDPFPLLDLCNEMLAYRKKGRLHNVILLNLGAALLDVGRYEDALKAIDSVKTGKFPQYSIYSFVYHRNLSSAYWELGKAEDADRHGAAAIEIYGRIKSERTRTYLDRSIAMLNIEEAYRRGAYGRVIEICGSTPPRNLYESVCTTLLCGRSYLGLGDKESAASAFEYVVKNGNRMFMAAEAADLLASINY